MPENEKKKAPGHLLSSAPPWVSQLGAILVALFIAWQGTQSIKDEIPKLQHRITRLDKKVEQVERIARQVDRNAQRLSRLSGDISDLEGVLDDVKSAIGRAVRSGGG